MSGLRVRIFTDALRFAFSVSGAIVALVEVKLAVFLILIFDKALADLWVQ